MIDGWGEDLPKATTRQSIGFYRLVLQVGFIVASVAVLFVFLIMALTALYEPAHAGDRLPPDRVRPVLALGLPPVVLPGKTWGRNLPPRRKSANRPTYWNGRPGEDPDACPPESHMYQCPPATPRTQATRGQIAINRKGKK